MIAAHPPARSDATPIVTARLVPFADGSEHAAVQPGSWFISHGLGGPAGHTYTEVAFTAEALLDPDGQPWPEHVIDRAVVVAARLLYGTAWAFHYRPDQYADAIERHGLRRRERVVIVGLELWS